MANKDGAIVWLLKKLMHRMVRTFEAMSGTVSEHMHFIADVSVSAFINLMMVSRMARQRHVLPPDALHLARVLSAQHRDCGSCVQSNVNLALRDGVEPQWLSAALRQQPEALPPELRDIYEFTRHILDNTHGEAELRDVLRKRYGDRGLIDLAYGIASAQIFALTKQALGFATSCSRIEVKVGASKAGSPVERSVHAAI
jgi:AhpD family alkylhydroperoxidase